MDYDKGDFCAGQLEENLKYILDAEFKFWGVKDVVFSDFEIQKPLVKIRDDVFKFSDEAKIILSDLYSRNFFEAYDKDEKLFVTKVFKVMVTTSISTNPRRVNRLYFYLDGKIMHSSQTDNIVCYGKVLYLSELSGTMTKAAR